MSLRKVNFVIGEFYHLYNRGNSRQVIFHDTEDYLRFITLMYTCNSVNNFRTFLISKTKDQNPYAFDKGGDIVSVGAYVLMSNHFHILITENVNGGISKFMQKLSTAYAMYYNKKYKRTGGIFEGKFKSKYLDTDKYLKYMFSYIHLNPVKLIDKDWKENGLKNKDKSIKFLSSYKFSSYLDHIGEKRIQNLIINLKPFPKYFLNKKDFVADIINWLEIGC